MSDSAGFAVRLPVERQYVFEGQAEGDTFAEPVPEFGHSLNVPLVCFIVNISPAHGGARRVARRPKGVPRR